MNTGILMSADSGVDFMIHGIFSYNFFGHEVWITTTHVCLLIVMLVIIGFAIAANHIYFYSDKQYFRTVRPEAAHSGLRCDASPGSAYVYADPLQQAEAPEAVRRIKRTVRAMAYLGAD